MYGRFDALGEAFGLPLFAAEARGHWIGIALAHLVNVAAFSPACEIVGHCFLAADSPGSAELAIFVHQESRRAGAGTAMLKSVLEWAGIAGLWRVWSMTSPDNQPAMRLQTSCGFRVRKSEFSAAELEIGLPVHIDRWTPDP
jgi:GNAT superfamily N-acetyltransferase